MGLKYQNPISDLESTYLVHEGEEAILLDYSYVVGLVSEEGSGLNFLKEKCD